MRAMLIDAGAPETCYPITATRGLADCPIANRPLASVIAARLKELRFELGPPPGQPRGLFVRGDAWLSVELFQQLREAPDEVVVEDADAFPLAWVSASSEVPELARRLPLDGQSFRLRYPWDLLRANELVVGSLVGNLIYGRVSPDATIDGHLVLGEGSRILPGVVVEGKVVIGRNCRVGPNCYLRGATSIGEGCHIGHAVEIKNSLVMSDTSIGHLSYCGDSIIGAHVNWGAGTLTANFRHDGQTHRSLVGGQLVDTGRRKFGTAMGDGVHTGIHTSIYPGRKLWPGVSTRPGAIVQYDVLE